MAGGSVGLAVASVGTPEGRPPVLHQEYVVPLTVALPIPASTPSWHEHPTIEVVIPKLGRGLALGDQVSNTFQ
jgi:hypothetical protein